MIKIPDNPDFKGFNHFEPVFLESAFIDEYAAQPTNPSVKSFGDGFGDVS